MVSLHEHSLAAWAPGLARVGRAVGGEVGRLYLVQLLLAAGMGYGWSLQFLYLTREAGHPPHLLALYHAHIFGMGAVLLLLIPRLPGRGSMAGGLLLRALLFPLLLLATAPGPLFLVSSIFAAYVVLFWVPFNTRYFSHVSRDHMALSAGVLFLAWPILGALLPGMAGATVARTGGYESILAAGALLVAGAALLATRLQPEKPVDIRGGLRGPTATEPTSENVRVGPSRGAWRERVAPLLLLEGAWQGVMWVAVPLHSLAYLDRPRDYGALLSLFGVSGALASLLVAWLSDHLHRRRGLLVGTTLLLALATLATGLTRDIAGWALLNGLVSFAGNLAAPFTTTAILENVQGVPRAILLRELFLNTGRGLGGVGVALAILLGGGIPAAIAAMGLLFLLYPLLALRLTGGTPEKA